MTKFDFVITNNILSRHYIVYMFSMSPSMNINIKCEYILQNLGVRIDRCNKHKSINVLQATAII